MSKNVGLSPGPGLPFASPERKSALISSLPQTSATPSRPPVRDGLEHYVKSGSQIFTSDAKMGAKFDFSASLNKQSTYTNGGSTSANRFS